MGSRAIIGLEIPPGVVKPVEGGVEDHHITIVYLGGDVSDADYEKACARAAQAAASSPPLRGTIGGLGTFPPGDDGIPVWVPVAVNGIGKLRIALQDLSASEHKIFIPHVTLTYLQPGEPLPEPQPEVPVAFRELVVRRGQQERRYPFGGSGPEAADAELMALAAALTAEVADAEALELAWGPNRRVETPGGVKRYHEPIGTPIEPHSHIPAADWLKGQQQWERAGEAVWKANQWKPGPEHTAPVDVDTQEEASHALRQGHRPEQLHPEAQQHVAAMDQAFKKAPPLAEPITAYRAAHFGPAEHPLQPGVTLTTQTEIKPGMRMTDAGYAHASLDPRVAQAAASQGQGSHLVQIRVPAGAKVLTSGEHGDVHFPRGSAFHVEGVGTHPETGQPMAMASLVTHKPLSTAEFRERAHRAEEAVAKAIADGRSTVDSEMIDPSLGTWKPERARMHAEIVKSVLDKHKDVPRQRKAIVAGGLGGAGKTTVLAKHMGVNRGDYLTLNPDDIKEEMAARGMIPVIRGLSPMEASPLAHEEAGHIVDLIAAIAQHQGRNLIWDITMSSERTLKARLADLAQAGYTDVGGVFVHIPVQTAVDRARSRYIAGLEKWLRGEGLGGRLLPSSIIRAAERPGGSYVNREVWELLKQRFQWWQEWDNSGKQPKKTGSRGVYTGATEAQVRRAEKGNG
jgi:2'-5' RNA ligase/predicted ABC-type ATPase